MQMSLINIELEEKCTFKLYFPWFSFYLQMRFIAHPKVTFFIFPRSEARLMGEESNFTTFAHSRIVCWFKMKSHYRFHCLLPHHIHSLYIINIFDKMKWNKTFLCILERSWMNYDKYAGRLIVIHNKIIVSCMISLSLIRTHCSGIIITIITARIFMS